MSDTRDCPVLIVGSGPAGWTAAIYAARAALAPVVIRGLQPGGQLTITTDVENYPGFAEVVQGPWLMEQMEAQARTVGVDVVDDIVSAIDLGSQPFVCTGESGTRYRGRTVVLATGASARWLGLDSEQKYRGHGVSACATCDGFFYRSKPVAVVGGGNTAVEEALYLSNIASSVTVVHRRDRFRAEKILANQLIEKSRSGNVVIEWNHVLDEVLGDDAGVTGVRIRKTTTGERKSVDVHGCFIAIGHTPNTQVFDGQLEMNGGYILVRGGSEGYATETSVPGVFAAGDVADHVYRQAITSAGSGCMAALDADRFLESQHQGPS